MLKNCRKRAVAALFFGVFLQNAWPATNSRFFIKHWDTGDGLPQNSVISTIQSRDGYLWVGTLDGLARFDGVHFEKFYDANTPGLNSTRIVCLFEDSHTNFWVGTENAGIVLVDQAGNVKRVDLGKGAPEARLVSACEDVTGGIWLRLANGYVFPWRDGKVNSPLGGVREFAVEGSNKVWVALFGEPSKPSKLLGLRMAGGGFPTVGALEEEISLTAEQLLMSSPGGGYWLVAEARVRKYRRNQVVASFGTIPGGGSLGINAACEDADGNLILGTAGQGVFW